MDGTEQAWLTRYANCVTLVVEVATVGRTKDGKIYHHLWGGDEIDALLKEHGLGKEQEQQSG